MKVITSNIRFDNPDDGVNTWIKRKDSLFDLLNSCKPQIIATQEGREPQLRELEDALDGFSLSDENRDWIAQRMYPCLYTSSELSVLDSGDLWLSYTPTTAGTKITNSAFPRLSTWIIAEHKAKKFLVVNLHLDHTTDDVRIEQALIIIKEIKKINYPKHPLILMGDFNSSPSSEVYRLILKELSLVDPWTSLSKEEETSYHRFDGVFDEGVRIDWILHSEEFEALSIELIKKSKNGLFPSDHFPVSCDIILK